MVKTSTDSLNKLYIILAIIALFVSWMPSISENYKIALLIVFAIILIIVYYSNYLKSIDEIEQRIEILENKIEKIEDLINIKSDIKLLKNICKIK